AYTATFTIALPDLTVGTVMPSASSAHFGDTITVSWSVTNDGTAGATGPWTDSVYLSTTPTLGAGAIFLGSSPEPPSGTLAPSASYTGQATVQLPAGSSLTAGTYYLLVLADAGGVVNEADTTTQTRSATIALAAAPPADLAASSVTSSLSAGQPGQSVTVAWTVKDAGGPATGSWTDSGYPSPEASSATPRRAAPC